MEMRNKHTIQMSMRERYYFHHDNVIIIMALISHHQQHCYIILKSLRLVDDPNNLRHIFFYLKTSSWFSTVFYSLFFFFLSIWLTWVSERIGLYLIISKLIIIYAYNMHKRKDEAHNDDDRNNYHVPIIIKTNMIT